MIIDIDGQKYDVPEGTTKEEVMGFHTSSKAPEEESDAYNVEEYQPSPSQPFLTGRLPADIKTGIYGAISGLGNIPSELSQWALSKQAPEEMNPYHKKMLEAVSKFRLPEISAQQFGLEGEPTTLDKAIQFGTELAFPIAGPEAAGAGLIEKGLSKAAPYAEKITSKLGDIFPATKGIATSKLTKSEKLAAERPGLEKMKISSELSKDVNHFLDKTDRGALRALIEPALEKASGKGGYKSLFDLQSNLSHIARDYGRYLSSSEDKSIAKAAETIRQKILSHMENEMNKLGAGDIAKMSAQGRERYRKYQSRIKPAYYAASAAGLGDQFTGRNLYKKIHKAFLGE